MLVIDQIKKKYTLKHGKNEDHGKSLRSIMRLKTGGDIYLNTNGAAIPYLSWRELGKDKCQLMGVTFWEYDPVKQEKILPKAYYVFKRNSSSTFLRDYKVDYDANALMATNEWARLKLSENSPTNLE